MPIKSSTAAVAAALTLAAAAAAPALGQYRVGTDGHYNDANNRAGSGGYNSPSANQYQSGLNYQIATGNVTGLNYFHGQTGTFSPNVLRTGTNNGSVQNFTRQSAPTNVAQQTTGAPSFTSYYNYQQLAQPGSANNGFTATRNGVGVVPTITASPLTPSADTRLQNLNNSPLDGTNANLPTRGQADGAGPVNPVGNPDLYAMSPLYGLRQLQPNDPSAVQQGYFDRYGTTPATSAPAPTWTPPASRPSATSCPAPSSPSSRCSRTAPTPTRPTRPPTARPATLLTPTASPPSAPPTPPPPAQPGLPGAPSGARPPGQPIDSAVQPRMINNALAGNLNLAGPNQPGRPRPAEPAAGRPATAVRPGHAQLQRRPVARPGRPDAGPAPHPAAAVGGRRQTGRVDLPVRQSQPPRQQARHGRSTGNAGGLDSSLGQIDPTKLQPAANPGSPVASAPAPDRLVAATPQNFKAADAPAPLSPVARGPGGDVSPDQPLVISSLAPGIRSPMLAQMMKSAEDQMRAGQFNQAVDTYDSAAEAVPNNPFIPLGRGFAELGASYYGKAEADLARAILAEPYVLAGQYDLKGFLGDTRLRFVQKDLQDIADHEQTARPHLLLAYIAHNVGQDDAKVVAPHVDQAAAKGADPRLIELMRLAWNLPAPPAK